MWWNLEPSEALDVVLPRDDIAGPYNEEGDPCPWPWEPIQLKGAPLGQYHCRYCGAMVMAGMDHLDYGPRDGYGLTGYDYFYMDLEQVVDPASIERWANEGGPC